MATFQLKDFASIAASLINLMQATQQRVTDFNVGAVVRTMLEACASELDELYQQILNGLLQAIPVSVYNSFNFPALTSQSAGGLITINIASQSTTTLISGGTTFTAATTGATYTLENDVTMAIGATSVQVPVVAVTAGSSGNLAASTQFSVSPQPSGFTSASNPNAFINGIDAESPADRLIRFNGYISTLQRGTDAAIAYGAKTANLTDSSGNIIEQVASAIVVEPYLTNNTLPISSIYCYIHNGVGGTSTQLVSQTQNVINGYYASDGTPIPGWKSAGVICTVAAATEQNLAVTAVLTAQAGFDKPTLLAQAISTISAYLLSIPTGSPALFAVIESLVMSITGVANFVISTPTSDTAPTATNYKIMPGTLTLS